jgi:hypothetical protein
VLNKMSKVMKKLNSEWTCDIEVETLGQKPLELSIKASEQQCKDIANRLDLVAIDELGAELVINREESGNIIHVKGVFRARVCQKCIITLDELSQEISDEFEAWYADPEQAVSLAKVRHERMSKMMDAEVPLLEENEDPEPVIDGKIDIGELVIQYLSLSLNEYPQAEGVAHAPSVESVSGRGEGMNRPFAKLKEWKKGKEKKT